MGGSSGSRQEGGTKRARTWPASKSATGRSQKKRASNVTGRVFGTGRQGGAALPVLQRVSTQPAAGKRDHCNERDM